MRLYLWMMLWFAASSGLASRLNAQDSASAPEAPSGTFSGDIVTLSPDQVIVARSILGKPAEQRRFWIKPETKVEGKLKTNVKVTVGFVHSDDGDVAVLIVVRPQKK